MESIKPTTTAIGFLDSLKQTLLLLDDTELNNVQAFVVEKLATDLQCYNKELWHYIEQKRESGEIS